MGNDVVELLDVTFGGIDRAKGMALQKALDELDSVVEIGDMILLTAKGASWAIRKDVIMQTTIEIAREILAGNGQDYLILKTGID